MKRLLLALVPWMVLASNGVAQTRSAEVLYTHRDTVPVRAFRLGDECFVPLDSLDTLGWQASVHDDRVDVKAEGKAFSLPFRNFGGKNSIPMRKALSLVGGGSDWIPRSDTLQVFAPISSVSVKHGRLLASSTLGIKPSMYVLSSPSRLVVEFPGTRLSKSTKQDVESGIRVSQYKENVVRVVMEAPSISELPAQSFDESRDIDIDLRAALASAQEPGKVRPTQNRNDSVKVVPEEKPDANFVRVERVPGKSGQVDQGAANSIKVETSPINTEELKELTLSVDRDTETSTSLSIALAGISKFEVHTTRPDPSTLEVTLPRINGYFADTAKSLTSALTSVSTRREGWNTVLVFQLSRPMGAEVVTDARGLQVRLIKPKVGDGRLAGKIVVVDPGHGGHDTGAVSAGIGEKNLTLPTAKYLADLLAQEGATVLMTRKDDSYPTLTERASLANQNNADFFISVHINKTASSSGASGSITFFHGGQTFSKILAECIQKELGKVSQLPSIGVWSDTKIYDSGYSVLRNTTKMPGVLLELGFINNAKDRKRMATADFQKAAAAAVVKGLKVYLGDAKEKE